jgi:hypothetical protein
LTYYNFVPSPEPGAPPFFVGTRYWSPSKDYAVGGMLELHFNPHWSVEVNGLFRQLNGKWAAIQPDGSVNSISPHPVVTWQFPVLAKYRFQGRKLNPFIEAGPAFRTAGNLNSSDPSHHGLTAGTGLEFHWRSLKIAPTVRYTLWAADKYPDNAAQTGPDQVEILLRLSRGTESIWRPLGRHASLGFTLGTNLTGEISRTTTVYEGLEPGQGGTLMILPGPRSLIAGPTLEVRLPRSFSVEVDALYRRISSASEQSFADGTSYRLTHRYVTWVFPVLAKYRFPIRGREAFVGLGPSFRLPQTLSNSSPYGATATAGVEFRVRDLKIAPAIRYTHWRPDAPWDDLAVRNHAELLVGFSF